MESSQINGSVELLWEKKNEPRSQKLQGKKVYVTDQISCTSSRVYIKRYEDFCLFQGSAATRNIKEADIVLVDTCAVNKQREDMSLEMVKRSEMTAKEGAKVIVCGCLSGINPQRLQEHFKGEFFSPKNEDQLAKILGIDEEDAKFLDRFNVRGRFMGGTDYTDLSWQLKFFIRLCTLLHVTDNRFPLQWVPYVGRLLDCTQAANSKAYAMNISQGCLGNCTFCVIPMSKGRTVSLPLSLIVEKIQSVLELGVKRIILTSEDTGAYGADMGATIIDLLKHIHKIQGNFKLYINFFDPRWLRLYGDELIEIAKEGRLSYLQLPLQSASNSVLKRMKRAYLIEQVLPKIVELKTKAPKVSLATQFIAGFPGETKEEFEETRSLVRKRIFHRTDVFDFSDRPGAETEGMPDHLPTEVISERVLILQKELRSPFAMPRY